MGCVSSSHIKIIYPESLDKETKEFTLSGYFAKAYVISVYDGDTIKINMKFGDKIYLWNCRLQGIDTPEIKVKRKGKSSEEIKKLEELKLVGLEAKQYLSDLILRKYIYVKCGHFDKYGRLLVLVFLEDNNKKLDFKSSVNHDVMEKYGNPYDGGTKDEFN